MSMTLYAHRLSQPSRAAEMLARELGIEYTFHEVDFAGGDTRTEWFTALNAFQTVPALVVESEGDEAPLHLAESQAIMTYLCRTASDQALAQRWYPGDQDPIRSARIDQWLAWYHGNVRRFDMFHHIMNLHMTLPMLKREIQATLLEPLQRGLEPGLATLDAHLESPGGDHPPTLLEPLQRGLELGLATLERHFESQQADGHPPTLLEEAHPTIADLSLGCELYQIKAAGYRFGAYPRINAWLDGLAERSTFKAVSEEIDALGREIQRQESDYLALEAFD